MQNCALCAESPKGRFRHPISVFAPRPKVIYSCGYRDGCSGTTNFLRSQKWVMDFTEKIEHVYIH